MTSRASEAWASTRRSNGFIRTRNTFHRRPASVGRSVASQLLLPLFSSTPAKDHGMTLILNNDEITRLLPIADCLDQLDAAYRDLGDGKAISRTRSDIYGPVHDNGRYVFKTMDGMVPRFEAAAVRLNSDVIRWGAGPGGIRKDKQRTAPGEKFVGLILLFSTRNGEPLAIMPDGVIQRLRVACANALGAKYMAAADASVYALIGSGWQASAQAMAMALVRPLEEIRIYSPTPAKRERLAT